MSSAATHAMATAAMRGTSVRGLPAASRVAKAPTAIHVAPTGTTIDQKTRK